MLKIDKEKKLEEILSKYNDFKSKIDILEQEIELLECNGAVEEDIIKLNKELKNYTGIRKLINLSLNSLSDTEKAVIELRYLNKNKLTWNQIGNVISYSADYSRRKIKVKAIEKMAHILGTTLEYCRF